MTGIRYVTTAAAMLAASIPPMSLAHAQESPADTAGIATATIVGSVSQRAPRQSWTADRRDFSVGDVITVLIDERTLATATSGEYAEDQRTRDLVARANIPLAVGPRGSASLGSVNDAESRQRGQSTRQNRFVGEVTVRVVSIDSGLLRIEGGRTTKVDRNVQEMTLTGWVRPQDVTATNVVESWRVGDANLVYASSGNLGRPRGGIIGRIVGAIWP